MTCGGSGLVAHTPHQVVDGELHTAPTGGVPEVAALLVGVDEGGEVPGEVACENHQLQGQGWSVVWSGGE